MANKGAQSRGISDERESKGGNTKGKAPQPSMSGKSQGTQTKGGEQSYKTTGRHEGDRGGKH